MLRNINRNNLFFLITQALAILFWGMPELIQKPFKIMILLFIFYCAITCSIRDHKFWKNICLPLIGISLLCLSVINSTFQSSVVNIGLSFFCIPFVFEIASEYSLRQKEIAKKVAYFLCVCMTVQLCYFRSFDGRPCLGYEINWSAAYLFIFFLYSKYINFKFGRLFVIFASFLLVSRLLILSLLLYYLTCFVVKNFKIKWKINWRLFQIVVYIMFFIFNGYFLLNVEKGDAYDSSINRLGAVNDGSNMIRFAINMSIINSLTEDNNLKYGYGRITGNNIPDLGEKYIDRYFLMPHNELLDCLAEFGYGFTIFSFLFSGYYFKKLFKWFNFCYMIPVLVYTLILWTRFLIVPSLEMFFILSILIIRTKKLEKPYATV